MKDGRGDTVKRYGLPKSCLLRKKREFDLVYRQGARLYGQHFSLVFLKTDRGFNRLGISIHKKTGNAVRRNRLKRIIREAFRLNRELFPLSSDIVFTVRPGCTLDRPADVCRAVRLLLRTSTARVRKV